MKRGHAPFRLLIGERAWLSWMKLCGLAQGGFHWSGLSVAQHVGVIFQAGYAIPMAEKENRPIVSGNRGAQMHWRPHTFIGDSSVLMAHIASRGAQTKGLFWRSTI